MNKVTVYYDPESAKYLKVAYSYYNFLYKILNLKTFSKTIEYDDCSIFLSRIPTGFGKIILKSKKAVEIISKQVPEQEIIKIGLMYYPIYTKRLTTKTNTIYGLEVVSILQEDIIPLMLYVHDKPGGLDEEFPPLNGGYSCDNNLLTSTYAPVTNEGLFANFRGNAKEILPIYMAEQDLFKSDFRTYMGGLVESSDKSYLSVESIFDKPGFSSSTIPQTYKDIESNRHIRLGKPYVDSGGFTTVLQSSSTSGNTQYDYYKVDGTVSFKQDITYDGQVIFTNSIDIQCNSVYFTKTTDNSSGSKSVSDFSGTINVSYVTYTLPRIHRYFTTNPSPKEPMYNTPTGSSIDRLDVYTHPIPDYFAKEYNGILYYPYVETHGSITYNFDSSTYTASLDSSITMFLYAGGYLADSFNFNFNVTDNVLTMNGGVPLLGCSTPYIIFCWLFDEYLKDNPLLTEPSLYFPDIMRYYIAKNINTEDLGLLPSGTINTYRNGDGLDPLDGTDAIGGELFYDLASPITKRLPYEDYMNGFSYNPDLDVETYIWTEAYTDNSTITMYPRIVILDKVTVIEDAYLTVTNSANRDGSNISSVSVPVTQRPGNLYSNILYSGAPNKRDSLLHKSLKLYLSICNPIVYDLSNTYLSPLFDYAVFITDTRYTYASDIYLTDSIQYYYYGCFQFIFFVKDSSINHLLCNVDTNLYTLSNTTIDFNLLTPTGNEQEVVANPCRVAVMPVTRSGRLFTKFYNLNAGDVGVSVTLDTSNSEVLGVLFGISYSEDNMPTDVSYIVKLISFIPFEDDGPPFDGVISKNFILEAKTINDTYNLLLNSTDNSLFLFKSEYSSGSTFVVSDLFTTGISLFLLQDIDLRSIFKIS